MNIHVVEAILLALALNFLKFDYSYKFRTMHCICQAPLLACDRCGLNFAATVRTQAVTWEREVKRRGDFYNLLH